MMKRPVVAIVEDDPHMREALHMVLTDVGFRAEMFASADTFLGTASGIDPVCALVDVDLGEASGLDLVRCLRAGGFMRPVIFMTASVHETVRTKAVELGCIDCLEKPFLTAQLLRAIARAMEAGRTAQAARRPIGTA